MSYLNHTLDHIGPMTKTVADNALMLEVMAGPDWRDPQWARDLPSGPFRYADAADDSGVGDLRGLRIGVISDSLGPVGATSDVIAAFEAAARTLKLLGATVSDVSVPLWSKGQSISMATTAAAAQIMVMSGGTGGYGHLGRVDPHATAVAAAQARLGGDDLPPMLKTSLLVAEHVSRHYAGQPFVKPHNLRLDLRRQIDAAFADVDVLITPTTPGVAHTLLTGRTDAATMIRGRGGSATLNTCPTDLTGHPSLTVPCGTGEAGMPVGLQLIGPRYAERLLYRVAFAFEAS
jgi:amidase